MPDGSFARSVARTWARDAAAFAVVLAERDPSWRSEVHGVAGGSLVLCGAGLYVNRTLGAGIDPALTDDDIDLVIERSAAVGVPPAVEVSPVTDPATVERLAARGFVHTADLDVRVLARGTGLPRVEHPDDVAVHAVESADDLDDWMEVSALGWGHTAPAARRAADVFARTAHAIDGAGMVIARDAADGRPLGCASLTVRDGIATLGGMSTIPSERGRGVQATLIHHRLGVARARGCAIAVATTKVGGASERNMVRHDFLPQFVIGTWTRPTIGGADR